MTDTVKTPIEEEAMFSEPLPQPTEDQTPVPAKNAQEARASILENLKPKKKVIDFFGQKVELRQTSVKQAMETRAEGLEGQGTLARMLIRCAYYPETDDLIFADEDFDSLMGSAFGGDWLRDSKALTEMTDVNFLNTEPA
jgi:hypothetical protein